MDVNAPDEPRAAVVLLHPHPAMGGNRYHPFIDGLFHRLAGRRLAAVRFDFSSADTVTATDEALTAIDEAARAWPRIRVVVAGYSFGSSVAVRIDDQRVIGWFLLAPQAAALAGARIGMDPRKKMIVVPALDQFSPPEAVEASIGDWISTSVSVAPGVDHFLGDVGSIVDEALEWVDHLVD
jgi:uncharacterized protein